MYILLTYVVRSSVALINTVVECISRHSSPLFSCQNVWFQKSKSALHSNDQLRNKQKLRALCLAEYSFNICFHSSGPVCPDSTKLLYSDVKYSQQGNRGGHGSHTLIMRCVLQRLPIIRRPLTECKDHSLAKCHNVRF